MLTSGRPLVEVAVDSLAAAEMAAAAGADRLELCQGLELGGLTPSLGLIEQVRARVSLPIHVMIRPRGGDFCPTADEIAAMVRDIAAAKQAGANGVVTGALTPDHAVDREATASLVAAAMPLPVTFHRAFDAVNRPIKAIEELDQLGVTRILTSGGAATAYQGRAAIARYVRKAGRSLGVIAAGGITGDHVVELITATGVAEIHLSGTYQVAGQGPTWFGLNTVPNPARLIRLMAALGQPPT